MRCALTDANCRVPFYAPKTLIKFLYQVIQNLTLHAVKAILAPLTKGGR